jgi:hypothetical protein
MSPCHTTGALKGFHSGERKKKVRKTKGVGKKKKKKKKK